MGSTAIPSFASYEAVDGVTFTTGSPSFSALQLVSSTDQIITDGSSSQSNTVYTFVSYVNFSYTISGISADEAACFDLYSNMIFNHPTPSVAAFVCRSIRAEVLNNYNERGVAKWTIQKGVENNSSSPITVTGTATGQDVTFGGVVNLAVYYEFVASASTSNPATLTNTVPSGSVTFQNGSVTYTPLSELNALYDPLFNESYGWIPTMNQNLYNVWAEQNDSNTWLNTIYGNTHSHLTNVNSKLTSQIANQETQIANQNEQIDQLQIIVDYVQATAAADQMSDNTSTFNNSAVDLMADEAALNNQADANVNAVDLDQLDLLGTYSQSMSFWMGLVAALPAAVGSYWEVLVFGFLIAFLLFILRLVR